MMNQVNAIVRVNVSRLNWPLQPFHARQFQSFRVKVVNVPGDVSSLRLRVFKPSGGFFELPGNVHVDGSWTIYAIGTCFPEVGSAGYELRAEDSRGNPTALGSGTLDIGSFSANAAASSTAGNTVVIDTVKDAAGASHTIKAVQNDDGEWTTIID